MNNILQLKGQFQKRKAPNGFGPTNLPKGKAVGVEHVLKLKIVKSYINIDWIQFRLAGNEEHTSIKTPSMQFQKAISAEYRVFDFQGNWLGTISGKSREELQFKIGNLVNRNGVFLLKPLKSGKGFRIQVLDK